MCIHTAKGCVLEARRGVSRRLARLFAPCQQDAPTMKAARSRSWRVGAKAAATASDRAQADRAAHSGRRPRTRLEAHPTHTGEWRLPPQPRCQARSPGREKKLGPSFRTARGRVLGSGERNFRLPDERKQAELEQARFQVLVIKRAATVHNGLQESRHDRTPGSRA